MEFFSHKFCCLWLVSRGKKRRFFLCGCILDHTRSQCQPAHPTFNRTNNEQKNQSLPVGTHAKGVIDIQICRRTEKKMSVRGAPNTAENAPEENMIKNVVCMHFVHDKNQHSDNKRCCNGAEIVSNELPKKEVKR